VPGEKAGLPARMAAAKLLAAVIDKQAPLDGLTDSQGGNPSYLALEERDRLLVRAILNAARRHRRTIEALIAARLERPLPAKAQTLSHLLHVGASQILFLDVPDSAAVDLAVSHALADPRTARFAGLVNGVLREIARRKERALPAALASNRDAPDWLIERLEDSYGEAETAAILEAHRHEPPIDFTVRTNPGEWAERLGGIVLPTGSVRVARLAAPVPSLPGFEEGAWWVQDAAASLPARLFGDVTGLRIADLCAAPGGKTAQLAIAGARVTAVEKSVSRARRLEANMKRLGVDVALEVSDLFDLDPAQAFDAVLLDAPCSSTGTIRRHPDVAWTKTPEDVAKLAELQFRMAAFAMRLVRPGGLMVFSNCSLDPLEGEMVARRLVAEVEGCEPAPLAPGEAPGIDPFITSEGHLRTTPAGLAMGDPKLSGMDGFFAARFRRKT
jgi:16S rRNA (cytosine967-C5)-methyltransferase